MIARAIFNKTPLPHNRLSSLPLGAVQPRGWLKSQLDSQAAAIEKDLDMYFPGAQGESSWLGGTMDDKESAVEALCALSSLAFVTGSESLQSVVDRFVTWAVNSQRENGDFGPDCGENWWPRILMLRVMRQYFMATGFKEPLKLMDRFFLYMLEALPQQPLTDKACARSGEAMLAALWLYNITGQKHLLRLCRLLSSQSLDWTDEMHIFPHIRDTAKQRPWNELQAGLEREGGLNGLNQKVNGRDYYLTSAVDVAFGLKTPGVINLFKSGFKEVSALNVGWPRYLKQHGVALSMFTGDDHLAGCDPARGVNLDAVAETIESIRVSLGLGDEFAQSMGDAMEKLALNAPIAAWDESCALRPRLVQANQLSLSEGPHGFYNAPEDSLCLKKRPLGLADQALSAYAASLWYATSDDGLAAVGYAPCSVGFMAGGVRVRVNVEGSYPFSDQVKIRVETRSPAEFPVYLRIPGWAGHVNITLPDGEVMQMQGGETACVRRQWIGEGVIAMDMNMQPRLTRWFHQSAAVEMGPMLMALNVEDKTRWNWAFCENEPMKAVILGGTGLAPKKEKELTHVLVKARKAAQWEMQGMDSAQPPIGPEGEGEAQVVTLTPFALTARRISQFPVIKGDN